MPEIRGVVSAQPKGWRDGLSAPRFASQGVPALDVLIALDPRDLHGGGSDLSRGRGNVPTLSTRYARFSCFPRFSDVNATTVNPTLAAVTEADASSPVNSLWLGLAWCAHAARFLGWGIVGLISAFASYAFGVGALVFGFLGYLRLEAQWWPAVGCLLLGYLSARGAVACLDLAFSRSSHQKSPNSRGRGPTD